MQKAIIGKKVGMTQIFDESGKVTHRPSSHGSWGCLKYVTARSVLGQNW